MLGSCHAQSNVITAVFVFVAAAGAVCAGRLCGQLHTRGLVLVGRIRWAGGQQATVLQLQGSPSCVLCDLVCSFGTRSTLSIALSIARAWQGPHTQNIVLSSCMYTLSTARCTFILTAAAHKRALRRAVEHVHNMSRLFTFSLLAADEQTSPVHVSVLLGHC